MISEQAIIHPSAKIAQNVTIGPFSVIGKDVEIDSGTVINSHVVIGNHTKIGKNNKIFQFSSIGEDPQDKKYANEPTKLIIGDDNIIRESVTISRGTVQGGGITKIGNNNLLMAYVHIAHDCILADNIVFSNNASIAGHVTVDNNANLGGFVGVHQFCNIGKFAFCAGASVIVKDVLPYIMVSGHPAQPYGLNSVGLKRNGFTTEAISILKKAYKVLFRQGNTLEKAVFEIEKLIPDCPELALVTKFIAQSERGIIR